MTPGDALSIVMPAKNEAVNLQKLLPLLQATLPGAELIVVNDGSTDNTVALCESLGVSVVSHQYSKGNGASIKSGARHASRDTVVFSGLAGALRRVTRRARSAARRPNCARSPASVTTSATVERSAESS